MHFSKPLLVALLLAAVPVGAQTAPGNFTYSAAKLTYRDGGIRLDGSAGKPARIKSPEIEVSANAIAFDANGSTITEVRARDNVALKVDLKPKTGAGEAVHIESQSDAATLTTGTRTLVLTGNLSGFTASATARRPCFRAAKRPSITRATTSTP